MALRPVTAPKGGITLRMAPSGSFSTVMPPMMDGSGYGLSLNSLQTGYTAGALRNQLQWYGSVGLRRARVSGGFQFSTATQRCVIVRHPGNGEGVIKETVTLHLDDLAESGTEIDGAGNGLQPQRTEELAGLAEVGGTVGAMVVDVVDTEVGDGNGEVVLDGRMFGNLLKDVVA